jgi:hypothetical protein
MLFWVYSKFITVRVARKKPGGRFGIMMTCNLIIALVADL